MLFIKIAKVSKINKLANDSGDEIMDNQRMADVCNDYFVSVGKKPALKYKIL